MRHQPAFGDTAPARGRVVLRRRDVLAGSSPDFASVVLEFNEALSQGRLHSLEGRNEANTTPTGFKQFVAELAHAYAAAA